MEGTGAGGGGGSSLSSSEQLASQNDGIGVYTLQSIVSHIGNNAEHGHYVCHIKKGPEGKWIFFNDDKVSTKQYRIGKNVFLMWFLHRWPSLRNLPLTLASCIFSRGKTMTGRFSKRMRACIGKKALCGCCVTRTESVVTMCQFLNISKELLEVVVLISFTYSWRG